MFKSIYFQSTTDGEDEAYDVIKLYLSGHWNELAIKNSSETDVSERLTLFWAVVIELLLQEVEK